MIHEQIARKIDSILSDNGARSLVFGTGSKLYIPGRNVAAKTGTTQDFHDAWAVGFTPSLATGVWVGNNDNHAMSSGADGSYVAAPIWNEYMTKALASYPNESFPDYDHSNLRSVDPNSLVKYYSKSSGKEISAEKAKKKDPSKVETRIDTPAFFADGMPSIPELQDTTDPMILRWKQSLQNQDLSNLNSKDNNNNN